MLEPCKGLRVSKMHPSAVLLYYLDGHSRVQFHPSRTWVVLYVESPLTV